MKKTSCRNVGVEIPSPASSTPWSSGWFQLLANNCLGNKARSLGQHSPPGPLKPTAEVNTAHAPSFSPTKRSISQMTPMAVVGGTADGWGFALETNLMRTAACLPRQRNAMSTCLTNFSFSCSRHLSSSSTSYSPHLTHLVRL